MWCGVGGMPSGGRVSGKDAELSVQGLHACDIFSAAQHHTARGFLSPGGGPFQDPVLTGVGLGVRLQELGSWVRMQSQVFRGWGAELSI